MKLKYRTAQRVPGVTLGKVLVLATLLAVCAGLGGLGHACAGSSPSEREVKAAFVYNFAKFVEFPSGAFANANAPIVIGVFGEDQFADALEKLVKGKTANGRRLEIKRFQKARDCDACHVLFVSSSENDRVLDRLKGTSILTIGESDGFARRGGIIGFVVDSSRVGFEVNVGAAKKNGLKISSKLLSLAKTVIG